MDWLIAQIISSSSNARATFEALLKLELWREVAPKFRAMSEPAFDVSLEFQSHWFTSGHRIREQIISDFETAKLLKHMMPKYDGCEKTLYRGEKRWNWDNGQIGFCWTDKIEVAETFAGFHKGPGNENGTVLIKGVFPPAAIISGPEPEQNQNIRDQEREFTIDPFSDVSVEAIRAYMPYDENSVSKSECELPEKTERRCQTSSMHQEIRSLAPIDWYP